MSGITPQEIKREFFKSNLGIVGIFILSILIAISILAMIIIPIETFQEWNNPGNWISYPKVAIPVWVNLFMTEKIPEHKIIEKPIIKKISEGEINLESHQFGFNYIYDDFPNDFIYEYSAEYTGSPLLQLSVLRPDGVKLQISTTSLPYSNTMITHNERIFSTDSAIKKKLTLQSEYFNHDLSRLSVEDIIFSQTQTNVPLKGDYVFLINLYGENQDNNIKESKLIIGGKAFGVMGTDELRRDLAVGLLWGTPLALFIGLVVSIASVSAGLLFGTDGN